MKNDFNTDLSYANALQDAPWRNHLYKAAFGPRFVCYVAHPRDGWWQRAGIDFTVILADSTTVTIDEKVRRKAWPDVLLETYSKWYGVGDFRNVPGWALKESTCDFVQYTFVDSNTALMLPFLTLQSALRENWQAWHRNAQSGTGGFRFVDAANDGYVTRSIAVPIATLTSAMSAAMAIQWPAEGGAA